MLKLLCSEIKLHRKSFMVLVNNMPSQKIFRKTQFKYLKNYYRIYSLKTDFRQTFLFVFYLFCRWAYLVLKKIFKNSDLNISVKCGL